MADHIRDGGACRRGLRFSSKVVIASVAAVVLYTVAIFCLEWANVENLTNVQVPNELTVSWYAFWTVEIVMLASIKKSKIKNKYEYERGDDDQGI